MKDSPARLVFHHVGVACADIESEAARLAPLGYAREADVFTDPRQGVRGVFLVGQAPRLELLEPLHGANGGVLAPWLKQEIKLYHLAYETTDLAMSIERLRGERAKLVVPPIAAVAFGGRAIAFLMLANRMLVELIARE
ncbi:MAG: VOC family protein [Betaproteobacteria bacterium]